MTIPVSVIVPVHNRERFIRETLDSILGQRQPPAEVIVVDDGSTEDVGFIRREYPQIIFHRIENSGPSEARNVGVALASSPVIAFCDSDDVWFPEKLQIQCGLLSCAPNLDYVFSNYRWLFGTEWSSTTKFDEAPEGYWDCQQTEVRPGSFVVSEQFYSRLIRFQPVFPSTVIMTKDSFHRIGGFNRSFSRKIGEDFEFTLRCVQELPIGYVKKPLVGIRRHDANLSGDTLRNVLGDIEILRFSRDHHRLAPRFRSQIEEQIVYRSCAAASLAFARADFSTVKSLLEDVPAGRLSWKLAAKLTVSKLPAGIASIAQTFLSYLASQG